MICFQKQIKCYQLEVFMKIQKIAFRINLTMFLFYYPIKDWSTEVNLFGEISHFSDNFLRKITNVFANNVKDLTENAIKVRENRYFDLAFKSFKRVGPACKLCFVLRKKTGHICR